jgi:uncharacterized membrane protein YuzA (DUF378 family)
MANIAILSSISTILLIVGGLNLGIEGLIAINLIQAIFGNVLTRLIYILIGVASGYLIYLKVKQKNIERIV